MPTEDELRDLLAVSGAPNRLDPAKVVRASKRRRVPQQIAAGAGGVLAVSAIAVFGIQSEQFSPLTPISEAGAPMTSEQDSAQDSAFSQESAAKMLPPDRINLCGAPLMALGPSPSGLQVEVVPPADATSGTAPQSAIVRLTNTGTEPVSGSTAMAPAVTLSQDGITLWHSNGPVDASAVAVELAPGESLDLPVTFTPVRCEAGDDDLEQFPADLPALPAGQYQLSAVLYFSPTIPGPTTELDLVSGPLSALTLR